MTHRERAQLFMDNCGTGNRMVSVDVLTEILGEVRREAVEEAAHIAIREADQHPPCDMGSRVSLRIAVAVLQMKEKP